MVDVIIYAVIALGGIAAVFALIIFFVEQKFKVIEDPKIDEVQAAVPGANCGGCGFAGCRAFAEAIVKAGTLENFNCPVGGADVMKQISSIMGIEAQIKEPLVAVVRCNGSFANAPAKVEYDGAISCQFAHQLYSGDNGCPYGCLGLGDCVDACKFDAMYMDKTTGLPVILQDKCVACGACVKACPRGIIEMRNKQKKNMRIYVCCVNMEKGAVARKNCSVACIGCGKCFDVCPHGAIEMKTDETGKFKLLAYIDHEKCKLCRKCAPVCPTNAIHEVNFPPRKEPVKTEPAKTEA
jgi:Na+-translocating ferredoxin:NAD+ oxidoreductase RNF subunit RnfB